MVTFIRLFQTPAPFLLWYRQHLSYDGCPEVRGEIFRTVLCCIVYWSCAQSWEHLDEQFLQFHGLGFVSLGPFHCAYIYLCLCFCGYLVILHICCIIVTRWDGHLPKLSYMCHVTHFLEHISYTLQIMSETCYRYYTSYCVLQTELPPRWYDSAYTTFNWTQLISHATRVYMPTSGCQLVQASGITINHASLTTIECRYYFSNKACVT